MNDRPNARAGFFFALAAYSYWGVVILYWKAIGYIDPLEVVAHRAFWAVPFAGIILLWMGRTGDILPALRSPRTLAIMLTCSIMISINWGFFVWAIAVERVLETALAYFINPLLTVALGAFFLGDKFNRMQLVAIALATVAVLYLTFVGGEFPWLSLLLASSFALYGILRKTVSLGPTQGFFIETLLILPFVLLLMIWLAIEGRAAFLENAVDTGLLLLCGPITAIPLLLYAAGGKRLRLSTLGLMQFIVPTIIFLIGVFLFKEPLNQTQLIAFVMIWIALGIYGWSILQSSAEK